MRFSIRDWLLLAVIVALAVSWGIDRAHLQRAARADREIVAGFAAIGVDPTELLAAINAPPLLRANTISTGPTISGGGSTTSNGFPSNSDDQSPPTQPRTVEERLLQPIPDFRPSKR
jgi:hypothetical protein